MEFASCWRKAIVSKHVHMYIYIYGMQICRVVIITLKEKEAGSGDSDHPREVGPLLCKSDRPC